MAQPLSEDPLYGVGEPEFDPDNIEFRKFGTARRGYSPDEVRPYLAAIADALRDSQRREGEMRSRLGKAIRRAGQAETELEAAVENLAEVEAQARQSVAAPGDITDAELTERLGEQVAQVLHSAREAAETRVSQAQLRAREMFEAAESEVTDIRWRAELVYGEKTTEAEAAANEIISGAQHDAARVEEEAAAIVAEARVVANDLLVAAQVEGEGLIQQAQEARFQILADMDKKRRTMRSQAERLKAGRDRLLQSHGVVQDTLNEIANELRASISEAKIKGDTAARSVEGEEPAGPEALHSEIADAALIGTISLPEVDRYEDSEAARKVDAFGRTGELADLRGEFTEFHEDQDAAALVADEQLVEAVAASADEVVADVDDVEPPADDVIWAADPADETAAEEVAVEAVVAAEEVAVEAVVAAEEVAEVGKSEPSVVIELTEEIDTSDAEVAAAIEELEAAVAEGPPTTGSDAVVVEEQVEATVAEVAAAEPTVADAAPEELTVAEIADTELADTELAETPAAETADVAEVAADTRAEARIIRVVDPRDSIRVLDAADAAPAATVEAAAVVDDAPTVDPGAMAVLADASAFEVLPIDDVATPADEAEAPAETDHPMDSLFDRLRSKRDGETAVDESAADTPVADISEVADTPEGDISDISEVADTPAGDISDISEVADTPAGDISDISEVADTPAGDISEAADTPAADTPEAPEPAASESVATPQAEAEAVELAAVATDEQALAPTAGDDLAIVEERDAAIGDLQGTIERRLKRVLADEQNHVLETINNRKRKSSVLEAMPPVDTHADMYVAAIVPQIEACYRAGAVFADPLAIVGIPNNRPFVESITAVIDPLRAMISELADAPEDDDATTTVRTFYRAFKKDELAIAASAIAVQAFSLGSVAAMSDSAPVRWVFFDHEEGCPDGHDNSLTPQQQVGEQFPSGAYHPPTSPRCRCVLVPADR